MRTLTVFLILSLPLLAELRSWRNPGGNRSFRAEFVSANATHATLKRPDGKLLKVALSKLHPEDRAWIRQRSNGKSSALPTLARGETAFDTLQFGDDRKTVEAKLKASPRVTQSLDDTFLGRTGLNGVFRTTVNGAPYSLYFAWSGADALQEITLRSNLTIGAAYHSALKTTWTELAATLRKSLGDPVQTTAYPAKDGLQDGRLLGSHLWHTPGDHSVLLCTGREGNGYMVAIRIAAEKIPPNQLSSPGPSAGGPGGKPQIAFKISAGKKSQFGFFSHTVECPHYFEPHGHPSETFEVLTPDKRVEGKRYPVIYALAPLTSRNVKDDRYRLGPLIDIREQGLHNKHQVICIKVMAIHRHMNWQYLQDVVVPYVDKNYPTIAEPNGRLLLGFSKTGEDVWKLLMANPTLFGMACAWDSLPKWEDLEPHAQLLRQHPPRLVLMGGTQGAMKELPGIHAKLTQERIPHLYDMKLRDEHNWSSGWIEGAMELLCKIDQ